ncbi:MAG: diguanylate cyclase [Myxococcales bacterium]|nr:diguanylate cyclase [Myxococcales bacterium]
MDLFDEPSEDERTAVVHLGDLKRSSLPAKPDRHILVRMDSANVGQVFPLDSQEFSLGRHTQSTIVLTDDGVSRKHARVVRDGERYVLEDLGSANGTFLRGTKIDRHPLKDGDVFQLGPTVMFRYTYTDASQERMLNKLYEASVRDSLTGCYNREHFEERLKVEVAYARRHNTVVSLVMFDLDHFKKINDTYGHPAGDAALIYVSERVSGGLRTEDVFARYGGEEFAVILRGIDLEGSRKVGDRMRSIVAATPVKFEDKTFVVTMSVGCSTLADCPDPSTTALVAIADRRLYAAKHGGRNRVVAEG